MGWTIWLVGIALATGAGALQPSFEALNAALNAAREDSGKCRMAALKGLKDARDTLELHRSNPNAETLTKARRGAEDAYDASFSACSEATQKRLAKTVKVLQAALKAHRDAAAKPTPREKKLREKRQCWNYSNDWSPVDPACHAPRDGHYPLDKSAYTRLMSMIRSAGGRFAKTSLLEKQLGYSQQKWVSTKQLGNILELLSKPTDRLEVLKSVSKRIVDLDNATKLGRYFSGRMRKDAMDVINQALRNSR